MCYCLPTKAMCVTAKNKLFPQSERSRKLSGENLTEEKLTETYTNPKRPPSGRGLIPFNYPIDQSCLINLFVAEL